LATPTQRAREALTERLRQIRRSTGATGAQFAGRLGDGWGQPKVSKIETGKQLPTPAEIEAWAATADAPAGELLDLLDRARIEYATFRDRFVELAGADRVQDAIGAAELAATRIAHYEPILVPGILQTADYARELLHLPSGPARSGASEEEINRMIASRLRRQAILYEPGRDITLILGEGALRTRVATPATMHAQREHIARLAETLSTATIGILPFAAQAPIATLHGWLLTDASPPSRPTPATSKSPTPSTSSATGNTAGSSSTPPPSATTPPSSVDRSTTSAPTAPPRQGRTIAATPPPDQARRSA
jgi:transcriptional regulator with XRE-family HTH domain